MDMREYTIVLPKLKREPRVVPVPAPAVTGVMPIKRERPKNAPIEGVLLAPKKKKAPEPPVPIPVVHYGPDKISAVQGMFLPTIRLLALLTIVVNGWMVMPTLAKTLSYFTDTEGAPANMMSTQTLDLIATTTVASSTPLSCGSFETFDVSVFTAEGSAKANYSVVTEKISGNDVLCDNLLLTAWIDDEEVYTEDPLLSFFYDDAHAPSDWKFKVKLPLMALDEGIPAGAECNVDLVFNAYCPMNAPGGYTDVERIPLHIVKVGECTGEAPCEPCTGGGCGDVNVVVENTNNATVTNIASSTANTGGNSANGGNGGNGGAGGGNGGNGGAGGTIITGNASSSVSITNVVNTNNTSVTTSCSGCCNNCGSGCSGNCSGTSSSQSSAVAGTSTGTTSSLKASIEATLNAALQNAGIKRNR